MVLHFGSLCRVLDDAINSEYRPFRKSHPDLTPLPKQNRRFMKRDVCDPLCCPYLLPTSLYLSLPVCVYRKPKSAHNGDNARQELLVMRWSLSAGRPEMRARACQATDVF
jgi:hypothetical protein